MVILIAGESHTGKTALAQKLTEQTGIPYLSIDHLKMGLIRSKNTNLTPFDDEQLTPYLWNIIKEIVKTVIENGQNIIIEGCYIPFDYKKDFTSEELKNVIFRCLIMSEKYLTERFSDVMKFADVIENRAGDDFTQTDAISGNARAYAECKKHGCEYILIDGDYSSRISELVKTVKERIGLKNKDANG